jgi:hypothetical protein
MSEKIYAKGIFIKTRETDFGDILKVSIKVADFAAFVKEHKNEAGYINLDFLPRKEKGEKGDTHYATLDAWKPNREKSEPAPKAKAKTAAPAKKETQQVQEDPFGNDL